MDDQLGELASTTIMNLFLVGLYGTLYINYGSKWFLAGCSLFSFLSLLNIMVIVGGPHEKKISEGKHLSPQESAFKSRYGSNISPELKRAEGKAESALPSSDKWEGPVYRQGERLPYGHSANTK